MTQAPPPFRRPVPKSALNLPALLAAAALLGCLGAANAQTKPPEPPADDAPKLDAHDQTAPDPRYLYPVQRFTLRYDGPAADLPTIDNLRRTPVTLQRRGDAWHAPDGKGPTVTRPLRELAELQPRRYHGSALRAVALALVQNLNDRGYIGVTARPAANDIGPRGDDRRADDRDMTILIDVARVARRRTLASGKRLPADKGINHPDHERIKTYSPLRRGEPVRKDLIDRYLHWLNRHPGRRVDVALGPAVREGDAVVDYLVAENRPWTVYGQIANTGTDTTGKWRQRLGYIHNQLTNHDDILSLDATTSSFKGTHAFNAAYERPAPVNPRLRLRAFGGFSAFQADDIAASDDVDFEGEQWWIGLDGRWNFFQQGPLFLDLLAGFRFQSIQVDNKTADVFGDESFFLPHLGLALERRTDAADSHALLDLAFNVAPLANTDEQTLFQLGRDNVEEDFVLLTWDFQQSFYLEPLLRPDAWRDPSTPASSTLAHEIALRFHGQYTFGQRVVPQFQSVVGGLRTVRGYDESTASADAALIASAEYRLHIPRLLPIDPDPYDSKVFGEPFRWAPQEVYGRPDWDLVAKAFLDVGRTYVADPAINESSQTLIGAGAGLEIAFRRNLRLRADWGVALEDANDVDAGDQRLHFVATFLY